MISQESLPAELRALVKISVAWLGRHIERQLGGEAFQRIESLRKDMAELRGAPHSTQVNVLRKWKERLAALSAREQRDLAHAFTLMLELMNACENAYRSHRILNRKSGSQRIDGNQSSSVIQVLTAHPTESRSPENLHAFVEIQEILGRWLSASEKEAPPLNEKGALPDEPRSVHELSLYNELGRVWRMSVARKRKPEVLDEADHVLELALSDSSLEVLLEVSQIYGPTFLRTWVGGDKDGHPGVGPAQMRASLQLSRDRLASYALSMLKRIRVALEELPTNHQPKDVLKHIRYIDKEVSRTLEIKKGDGKRMKIVHAYVSRLHRSYRAWMGVGHPELEKLRQLLRLFPALVLPLEIRESSDLVREAVEGKKQPVTKMLEELSRLAQGAPPQWYVRGFILSMVLESADLEAGVNLVKKTLGRELPLPVIPLLEQQSALLKGPALIQKFLDLPEVKRASRNHWGSKIEVMVGYSDSAKEMGVLPSRLQVSRSLTELESTIVDHGLIPVFFHGSGGSVDRGGGSIDEQTSWWPRSALEIYKATVQGEMIERNFASPVILRDQLERIHQRSKQAQQNKQAKSEFKSSILTRFAERVRTEYQSQVADPGFLGLVEVATVYPYLDLLRLGSRPSKRAKQLSVSGLRAIPWIMCWTQSRTLFPTWWGVGSAWEALKSGERHELEQAFNKSDIFRAFVKALGFTLAKVELAVWELGLEVRGVNKEQRDQILKNWRKEYENACEMVRSLTKSDSLVSFRPWLGASIRLRSPMIHPLNLLQWEAMKRKDALLMRITVTGISSGMMTTG